MTSAPLDSSDLNLALAGTESLWPEARGGRFLLTGGTGFFGSWLLETLLHASRRLDLGVKATVVSRNPVRFQEQAPHLALAPEVQVVAGSMLDLSELNGRYDYLLHLATETSHEGAHPAPARILENNLEGTRQALRFAARTGVRKMLFTSSGAVYGPQSGTPFGLTEDSPLAPDPLDPRSAYGESKRAAELLCAIAGNGSRGLEAKIARCFAFVGPHLQLDVSYAIGNFIRDALAGKPIRIGGDGTPLRSYLYGADLAAWLWTVLFRGLPAQAYNVGSEQALSVLELAELVAEVVNPESPIIVARPPVAGVAPQHYLPSTRKARTGLGLQVQVGLRDAIFRTAAWHRLPVLT